MNAFLYLQNLINSANKVEILRTSENHDGDLSFYAPNFEAEEKLRKDKNIQAIHVVDGFWNICFKPSFWQQQLLYFITTPFETPSITINSPYIISFQGLYKNLVTFYEDIFQKPYNILIQETPDLTNPQDLAIIKSIMTWEFRHIILGQKPLVNDRFIQQFFDWWQTYKIKGSVLRLIDPTDINKTKDRMLVAAAYNKIIKDIAI